MYLLPAIDLRDGRCVRLHQGDFALETVYEQSPQALLRRYETLGARWVHVVDLDGAGAGTRANGELIADLARASQARLQVGGGVRSAGVIESLLSAGVARVVIGSAAAQRPAEVGAWLRHFGPERVCLAFDVRIDHGGEPRVHTHGWTRSGGVSLWEALEPFAGTAVTHVLCTDIARDGTLRGPNVPLYRAACTRHPDIAWQASGGIRSATDLACLARSGVAAAVSGKALLESRISDEELRPFLPDASSPASTYAPARS